MAVITVRGLKRSEGIIEETKSTYKGFKLFCTYKSLDPDTIGEEVGEKFFSDKLLGGIVPEVGDQFELLVDPFDGRVKSVVPVVKFKGFKDAPHASASEPSRDYSAKPEDKNGNANNGNNTAK